MMRRNITIDPTEGPILKKLLLYMYPIVLSNFVQIMFSVADKAVLKQMGTMASVAGINAISIIINLLVQTCVGLSNGAVVLTAQAIGRRDGAAVRRTVSTALITASVLGITVAIAGFCTSGLLPSLVDCPDDCYREASVYLSVYLLAAPAILLYNFCGAVIRASGDSRTPSLYILIAGGVNVALNIILCFVLEEKVAAVAIATLASQCVGAVLTFSKLWRLGGDLKPDLRPKNFNVIAFKNILRVGLPCAFSQALFAIGNLPVNQSINSFGSPTIAGNGAALEADSIEAAVTSGLGSSVLTFVGQNWGCGKKDRIRRTVLHALWLGFSISIVMSTVFMYFHEPFLRVFIPEGEGYDEALSAGISRMIYINTVWFIVSFKSTFEETVKGMGVTLPSTANNLIFVLILRCIWVAYIFPMWPHIENIYQCYLSSWLATLLGDIIIFVAVGIKKQLFAKDA